MRALELAHGAAAQHETVLQEAQQLRPIGGEKIRELRALYDDYRIYTDSAILFSALAAESVLNWYGVVRLGEDHYSANCERLGLTAKLSAVLAICLGRVVERDDEIFQCAATLSTLRNALAHPKAKEVTQTTVVVGPPQKLEKAKRAVESMERFLALLLELDPQAGWIVGSA